MPAAPSEVYVTAHRLTAAACHFPLPQSHIGNGVAFLNRTLSAKMFSPNANAEGRCG